MFEGYKPTNSERRAIQAGLDVILSHVRSDYEVMQHIKAETRGYGLTNDRVPLIAAKGICVSWFLDGATNHAGALLRDWYNLRPASIYMTGLGASRLDLHKITQSDLSILRGAKEAYNNAFKRMNETNRLKAEASDKLIQYLQ